MIDAIEEIREKQRQAWNRVSPGWKKWDLFTMEWLQPIGENLAEVVKLNPNDRVLDVATGTGEPGLTIARKLHKGKVIGTDIAEDMVNLASQKARLLGIQNYETRLCNECKFPFQNDYFDAVVCRHGLMFFPNMVVGLKEMRRVLKPKRKVSVSAWALPKKNPWATTSQQIVAQMLGLSPPPSDAPGLFRCREPGTLTKLLQQAGFKEVCEYEIHGILTFDSPEQYWQMTTEVAAPITMALEKANPEMRERIKELVVHATKGFISDKVRFPWSSWIAVGMK